MKLISHADIVDLGITPNQCIKWTKEALLIKNNASLPPKYSLHLDEDVFINTMPCCIPKEDVFGVKVVSRYPNNKPTLDSQILLFSTTNGEIKAIADGNWITAMRTGAVAAVSIDLLKNTNAKVYSFIGLGNTARATLLCLLESNPNMEYKIKLLKYKGQEESFIKRFEFYDNIEFELVESYREAIIDLDVIISSITSAKSLIGKDSWFKNGVLVVPIHTRGFQNCDLFFDRVLADDADHVKGFKYFNRFKNFCEVADVLQKKMVGRESSSERIIVYNIGIALHDVYFLKRIFDLIESRIGLEFDFLKPTDKFWV